MPRPPMPSSIQQLPEWDADEEKWTVFKQEAYRQFVVLIQNADREFAEQPYDRLLELRRLRRAHHLIVVSDRIRRESPPPENESRYQLRKAAELVVDRTLYNRGGETDAGRRRSRSEERMLTSARVNWHKLMRAAGSQSGSQGRRIASDPAIASSARIIRKIRNRNLKASTRAETLRKYIEERLAHLVAVSDEATLDGGELPRQIRLVVRELRSLLVRTERAKEPAGRK